MENLIKKRYYLFKFRQNSDRFTLVPQTSDFLFLSEEEINKYIEESKTISDFTTFCLEEDPEDICCIKKDFNFGKEFVDVFKILYDNFNGIYVPFDYFKVFVFQNNEPIEFFTYIGDFKKGELYNNKL